MRGEDRAKQWRSDRIHLEDGSSVLLRSIQCRRCVGWETTHPRAAKAWCGLWQRKVHMLYRCDAFYPSSAENVLTMVMESDDRFKRVVVDGVEKWGLSEWYRE